MEFVRAFTSLSQGDLPLAGGKGANLGAMVRAGLPVPPGFVVLTDAYRLFIRDAGIQPEIERLALAADADSNASLDAASAAIRALFAQDSVPEAVAAAVAAAYAELGGGAVAVRSSATAEDLPDASFAGQQETYLNISGQAAVVDAVRRCWSSLWTARALAYRVRNRIAPGDIALAVVVQRLVDAEVSGVLFTADPVSGRRDRMVVNGAWGLGESVVSGLVTPDHWLTDGVSGAVIEEHVARKTVRTVRTAQGTEECPVPPEIMEQPVLDHAQVAELVALGRRTAEHFGAPQDMEWAFAQGELHLLQSRPITTLFPLPEPLPAPEAGLRIYLTLQGMQGFLDPLTPAGVSVFRSVPGGVMRLLHLKPAPGASFLAVAAGRIYIDATGILRTQVGRQVLASDTIDRAMGMAVQELLTRHEDRLGPVQAGGGPPLRLLPKGLLLTVAGRAMRAMASPARARRAAKRSVERFIRELQKGARQLATPAVRVRYARAALGWTLTGVIAQTGPLWAVSLVAQSVVRRRLKAWGIDTALFETVARSVPHNPTTEMDLALWRVSRHLLAAGAQPRPDQPEVRDLLDTYGHRAVREIDVGIPRWREDPSYILHLIETYMAQSAGAADPEHHVAHGKRLAEEAVTALTQQVRHRKGPIAAAQIRLLLHRYRELAGVREWHKFYVVHVLAVVRQLLQETGDDLVRAGLLGSQDDVFFLNTEEFASGRDLRAKAAQGREDYLRDMKRRSVPLAMTSQGEVSYGAAPRADGVLSGLGASAGSFEGVVRVILDPHGARLEPGEILVAPATDPAWTPLFLTAGALVTETGGMISHGSIVAREYGIPAVVGVPSATTVLHTGQRIRVDGSAGTVAVLD